MNIPLVDLKRQYLSIKAEIDEAISHVIEDAAFVGGKYVRSFEEKFAAFCGVEHCIGVGNGTDALYLALRALGIGPGDEVIVPANSFIATSEAVTMTGARVAFVDIDPQTYTMDPNRLEDLLKKGHKVQGSRPKGSTRNLQPATGSNASRSAASSQSSVLSPKSSESRVSFPPPSTLHPVPRAVIPVHLYGHPADMDPIMGLARQYGLKVVEDAAQAHGAVYRGRPVGSLGDMACFSFYPGKNLGAYGDGGAIVTNDPELALRARTLADHGRVDKYNHDVEGVNSRLDGLQAAILEVKLRHLPDWTERRRQNAARYNHSLKGVRLTTPVEADQVRSVYHLYVVRAADRDRKGFQEHLMSVGIATGIHYPIALPRLKAYSYLGHEDGDFPEAERASREILSLPMFPELTPEEQERVAAAIREFMAA